MIKKYYSPFPSSLKEFERKFDLSEAHKDLFLACAYDKLSRTDLDNVAPLTRVIGFPEDYTQALLGFFENSGSHTQKEGILALTFHTQKGSNFFATLDERVRIGLSGAWVRPMLEVASKGVPFGKTALASLYTSTSQELRQDLVKVFERNRIKEGYSVKVYEELWAQKRFERRLDKAQLSLESEVIH